MPEIEESVVAETEATEVAETSPEEALAAEVEADLAALDESDPQRKLARTVEAELAEMGKEGDKEEGNQEDGGEQPQESKLAQILKQREEEHEAQQEAKVKAEAETIRAEALKLKEETEQFRAQVQNQYNQIRTFVQTLRTNPGEALRMAGIDPEEFLFQIARDGTPEGAQHKELQELRRKTQEFEAWQKKQEEARKEAEKQAQMAKAQEFQRQVETKFITTAKNRPMIVKAIKAGLTDEESLINEGHQIADKVRKVTRGQEASLEDIIEYIDERLTKAYKAFISANQAPAPKPVSKPAPSVKPGKKTLSSDDASVRTALGPSVGPEDSEDDRRARAAQAVRIVMEKAKARGAEE